MAEAAETDKPGDIRAEILADPSLILDDREVMEKLISASAAPGGRKVVDLRGALVTRLEQRLSKLETTHRSVIAAAYENLAGASQIQRAVLLLLEQQSFTGFLRTLTLETPELVAVECARLCIETDEEAPGPLTGLDETLSGTLTILPPGGTNAYFALTMREGAQLCLRKITPEADVIFGEDAGRLRSEALIRLDLGGGRAGMLAFGSADNTRFSPDQGGDLLEFFGGVVQRAVGRWLPADG